MAKVWNKEKDTIKEIEFWDMNREVEISKDMLFSGFETWEYNDDTDEMVIVEDAHCLWSELIKYADELADELNEECGKNAFKVWTYNLK